jgi:hypothetical protein
MVRLCLRGIARTLAPIAETCLAADEKVGRYAVARWPMMQTIAANLRVSGCNFGYAGGIF